MPAHRHELVLTTTDADEVLLRVITVLQRRGCRVQAASYQRADRHRAGRLRVVVEARGGRPHKLADWLEGIVDVLHVEMA